MRRASLNTRASNTAAWFRLGIACAGTVLVCGCVSVSSFDDLAVSRKAAADSWIAARQKVGDTMPKLEGRLGLKDALQLAMAGNRKLQVALQERSIADGKKTQSYAAALPNLSANASYTRLDEVSTFDIGGQSISMGFPNNYSADLTVRQPVFHGGAIARGITMSKLGAMMVDEQIRNAVQDTIFGVAKAYFDVLLSEHLYKMNEDAFKSAQAHLADVERKARAGVASEYDVLRARVEMTNFKAEMTRQKNAMDHGRTELFEVIGVSQDSSVEMSDTLAYRPIKPVLQEAIRIAKENRPDLYGGELAVRLQREALALARSRYWPQVDVYFSQKMGRPDPHSSMTDAWGDAWVVGGMVTLPLFDGFSRGAQVDQEKARLEQRRLELTDAEERAMSEVKRAVLDIASAEEIVESQTVNLEQAREGLRLVEAGYKEGIRTETDVIDARAALTRTQALYYQAIYSHTIARMGLQRGMGILGPAPGEKNAPAKPGDPREKPFAFENKQQSD